MPNHILQSAAIRPKAGKQETGGTPTPPPENFVFHRKSCEKLRASIRTDLVRFGSATELVYRNIAPRLARIDGFDAVPVMVSGMLLFCVGLAFGCRNPPIRLFTALTA